MKNSFSKLKIYMKSYKKEMFGIFATILIFGLCDVSWPVLQRYALNHFVEGKTLDTMPYFILVYCIVIAVMCISGYLNTKICLSTELYYDTAMRNDAFAHLQKLSLDYYNQNSVGYIHARVMSDVSHIGEMLTWNLCDCFFFSSSIIGSITVMLFINPKLTGYILLVLPLVSLFYMLFQGKLFDLNRKVRESNSKITSRFNEGIIGAKTIKSLVIEEKMSKEFNEETQNIFEKSMKAARLKGVFRAVSNMAAASALSIVLWKGGLLAGSEVGTFALFMSYARELIEPINMIVENLTFIIMGKVNVGRYTALMETVPTVQDEKKVEERYGDCFNPKKENWEPIRGDIEFENVDFKYPDGDEYVLKDFSLKIPFGTNIAIVGETGAGKSTLVNLMCRFFEPTKGRILIDGKDARERSLLWLHSSIGYVLQTPHLFSGTLRDNLLYAKPDATEEEIDAAIDLVSARRVNEGLEKGLDTDAGEGGDLLSAGERQLISFARAILANPKLLILDEATASVDTITEQHLQNAIQKVIKGRTSVVIAHRLSTIQNADIILVVKDGKIVEQGTHRELLDKKAMYFELWNRQYEDEASSKLWEGR